MPQPGASGNAANPYMPYPASGNNFPPYPTGNFGSFPAYPGASGGTQPTGGYPPYPGANNPGYNNFYGGGGGVSLATSIVSYKFSNVLSVLRSQTIRVRMTETTRSPKST